MNVASRESGVIAVENCDDKDSSTFRFFLLAVDKRPLSASSLRKYEAYVPLSHLLSKIILNHLFFRISLSLP